MGEFPRLSGRSWILRRFELADLPLIEEASQDDAIPWITSVPATYTREGSEDYIHRQWSRFDRGIGCSFAIARADDDGAVGSLYLDTREADEGRATLGYWVVKSGRRRGAAKAAVQMATDHSRRCLGIACVQLLVEP